MYWRDQSMLDLGFSLLTDEFMGAREGWGGVAVGGA